MVKLGLLNTTFPNPVNVGRREAGRVTEGGRGGRESSSNSSSREGDKDNGDKGREGKERGRERLLRRLGFLKARGITTPGGEYISIPGNKRTKRQTGINSAPWKLLSHPRDYIVNSASV